MVNFGFRSNFGHELEHRTASIKRSLFVRAREKEMNEFNQAEIHVDKIKIWIFHTHCNRTRFEKKRDELNHSNEIEEK